MDRYANAKVLKISIRPEQGRLTALSLSRLREECDYGSCLENKKPKSGGVTCHNFLDFRSLVSS